MPRGDRTGPDGFGPMTGRAAGYCAGYNIPGFMNPIGRRMDGGVRYGRGLAWRRGYGRGGYGRGFLPHAPAPPYPTTTNITPQDEISYLQQNAEYLKEQLDQIAKRLELLQKE